MEEFGTSLKAALYERSKSPFYGAFIISWCIWNWRLLYYLITCDSNLSFDRRICYISSNYVDIYHNLWHPLWSAAVVFVGGNVLTIIFRIIQIQLANFRKENVEKLEMLSKDEVAEAKKGLIDYENRISTSSVDLKRRSEGLEEQIKERNERVTELETAVRSRNEEVRILQEQLETAKLGGGEDIDLTSGLILEGTKEIDENEENFDTAESSVLQEEEGTVLVWAYVSEEILKSDGKRYSYVLAHASNGGANISKTPLLYSDAWSISLFTDDNKKVEWRFWATNSKGEGGKTVLSCRRKLSVGWHLFGVVWSKRLNIIRFIVDKRKEAESKFEHWPEQINEAFHVGTWPSKSKGHYFNSKIGDIYAFDRILTPQQIEVIHSDRKYSAPNFVWTGRSDPKVPQGLVFKEVELNGRVPKTVDCTVVTLSDYVRFGFKFRKTGGDPFDTVSSFNSTGLLMHVSKEIGADRMTVTGYKDGTPIASDKLVGRHVMGQEIKIILTLDDYNLLTMTVNNRVALSVKFSPEDISGMWLMAWGDGNEMEVTVQNLEVIF